ncbi:MAG: class I SAM-dependent methyltransferase [Acidobacteria bacterium]|nr:class I SAM-dependent methyltransferase [Acidobacteriota bacterium]
MRVEYLELLKRTLTNFTNLGGADSFETFHAIRYCDPKRGDWLIEPVARPLTFLSKGQLDLIEVLLLELEQRKVPGDLIEAGVWRGGAIIFMRALLNAYEIEGRCIYAADSFCGIPPNETFRHDPVDSWSNRWVASIEEVKANIARFNLLDERVEFVPGYFADSLGALANKRFAMVRLDSDAHDSIMTSLEQLYPLLTPGGVLIIDDWHLIGCRFAVEEFRKRHAIAGEIAVKAGNAYWFKPDREEGENAGTRTGNASG